MAIPAFTAESGLAAPGEGRVEPALRWGSLKNDGCKSGANRKYSAILWDIPWGKPWEATCRATPGPSGTTVAGLPPSRCVNTGFNIWGEWLVYDSGCGVPPKTRCPSPCYEANVACAGAVVWNTCWCPKNGSYCPTNMWPAGVCVGFWWLGCHR